MKDNQTRASWTVKVSVIIDVAARDLVSEVVREVLS